MASYGDAGRTVAARLVAAYDKDDAAYDKDDAAYDKDDAAYDKDNTA